MAHDVDLTAKYGGVKTRRPLSEAPHWPSGAIHVL
jgi:hypothetical protein